MQIFIGLVGLVKAWTARPWRGGADRPPPAPRAFTAWQGALLLAGFALLVVLRMPQVWAHGRFYSEEISVFFAYGWHRPAAEALFRSFAGYLNLGANASTLLAVELVRAHAVPLEHAPYVTMGISLFFQIVPAVLLLVCRSSFLASRWSIVTALLIVAIAPLTEEVFAHSLHIQFHLALSAALVLAMDVQPSRAMRTWCLVPLALAPLCGPGAILLLPLFVLRAFIEKDRDRLVQAAVLGLSSAVQLGLFYTESPLRGQHIGPATLANILFVRFAVMPVVSAPIASLYGEKAYTAFLQGGLNWWLLTAMAVAWFMAMLVIASRQRDKAAFWLISSALLIGVITFGIGMLPLEPFLWFSGAAGERYNFLPLVLMGLGMVALAGHGARASRLWRGFVLLFLASGALTYMFPLRILSQGPDWRTEVARWKQDPAYRVRGWPETWSADLSGNSTPCAETPSESARRDPGYCESEWVRQVKSQSVLTPPPQPRS